MSISAPRIAFSLLALGAAACRPSVATLTAPGLPDAVAWIGLVGFDSSGALVSSTGLLRRESGAPSYAVLEPTPDRVLLVGYDAPTLDRLFSSPDPDALFKGKLILASSGVAALPAPLWSAEWRLSSSRTASIVSSPPRLTAPWLPKCPRVLAGTSTPVVDSSCAGLACARPASESDCRVSLDLCSLGTLEGTVGATGAISFDKSTDLGDCSSEPPLHGSLLNASCTSGTRRCRVTVYPPGFRPTIQVATKQVIAGVPFMSPDRDPTNLFPPPLPGYIFGLVALQDRVIVGHHGGTFSGPVGDWSCTSTVPDHATFLDPETLAPIKTISLPPCSFYLLRDPVGRGFLTVSTQSGTSAISRYDQNGAVWTTKPLRDARLDPTAWVSSAYVGSSSDAIALSFVAAFAHGPAHIAMLDPTTLGIRALSDPIANGELRSLGPAGPGRLGVVDDGPDVLYLIDPSNAAITGSQLRIECTNGSGVVPTALAFPTGGPLVLASIDSNAPVLYTLPWPALNPCGQATFFEFPAVPYAIHPSWDPSLLLVAVTRESADRGAAVALFDPVATAYVPGALTVGQGAVIGLDQDPKGRVFGALPWTGTVFRAAPASP
jgi:hypothetical protein